jgi:UDP-N-acetyl-2-amino-2-deoxyglucuronate dehydrogenase
MSTSKRFALIGAGGYIAPRHMVAIKETDNDLVTILDPNDSIGVIDKYFPNAAYFSEYERFDRHVDRLQRSDKGIDYISIASPNYLHDAHIRFALKNGAHAICEKPMVLNPYGFHSLRELELETGKNIFAILQLRLHPSVLALKEEISKSKNKKHKVSLDYITPRGKWYQYSWKGDFNKSGGISTNIGIHFFDMLLWIFGDVRNSYVEYHTDTRAKGHLELKHASVDWNLSIDYRDLPYKEWRPFRSIKVEQKEMEFSEGFTDLHTKSYEQILAGNGYRIDDAIPALELVHQIRNSKT